MQTPTGVGRARTGLILMLFSATTMAAAWPANRIQNPRIGQDHRQEGVSALEGHRGIRSYGPGGSRGGPLPTIEPPSPETLATQESAGSTSAAQKISGSPMAGSVAAFTVNSQGSTAVFIADKDTEGRFELYSAPVDGSASPVKISSGLTFGSGDNGVRAFQISANGARVLFLADANAGSGSDDLFSVPIDGSAAPVQLNTGSERPVAGFGIAPDSTSVLFFGVDTSFGSNAVELYRAVAGVASSAVQISDVGQGNPQGDVVIADFSPDSSRAVYAADGGSDNLFQWYSVPMDAVAPGLDVQLSNALSTVGPAAISPDGSRVVYASDESSFGKLEVISQPIAGGAKIQLNPTLAGNSAFQITISPDGNRVAYLADQDTSGVTEVYGAQMLVAASGTRLNTAMAGNQFADTLTIAPDSATVLYEADQDTPDTHELFGAPIDAATGPITLHAVAAPDNVGSFAGAGTPIIDGRAVYPVLGDTTGLFSVPYDASEPYTRISSPAESGDTVLSAFLPGSGARLMAYGVGPDSGTFTDEIRSISVRGDLPAQQINLTAGAGSLGVVGYEITADERYGVYLQDQDTAGKIELYSSELDSDADGAGNAVDNCPFMANASQDPVVFGATLVAASSTAFAWSAPADVRFARGPLDTVDVLATDLTGTLRDAQSYTDASTPGLGAGWFYLFAPDCSGGSYQTTLGAEPDRDMAGLP
jgi:Tol biopolymer transport system component